MPKDNIEKILRWMGIAFVTVNMLFAPFVFSAVPVHGQEFGGTNCDVNEVTDNCKPATFREIEFIAVRLLYGTWACGGFVFMILLVVIGFTYMTSAGDQAKVEEAKKRGTQWVIGLLLFFFSQPIVATLMRGLIGSGDCFDQLQDPGFTFFFATVCTEGDRIVGPGEAEYTIDVCYSNSTLDNICEQMCTSRADEVVDIGGEPVLDVNAIIRINLGPNWENAEIQANNMTCNCPSAGSPTCRSVEPTSGFPVFDPDVQGTLPLNFLP